MTQVRLTPNWERNLRRVMQGAVDRVAASHGGQHVDVVKTALMESLAASRVELPDAKVTELSQAIADGRSVVLAVDTRR